MFLRKQLYFKKYFIITFAEGKKNKTKYVMEYALFERKKIA